MDPDVAMTIDKLPDPRSAMGREIICNNVNLLALGKAGHDLVKEGNNSALVCRGAVWPSTWPLLVLSAA